MYTYIYIYVYKLCQFHGVDALLGELLSHLHLHEPVLNEQNGASAHSECFATSVTSLATNACFYTLGVLFMGVLVIRAILFRVYTMQRDPEFVETPRYHVLYAIYHMLYVIYYHMLYTILGPLMFGNSQIQQCSPRYRPCRLRPKHSWGVRFQLALARHKDRSKYQHHISW